MTNSLLEELGISSSYFQSTKIKSSKDIQLKSPQMVAERVLILSYMIGVYYDVASEDLHQLIQKQNLSHALTKEEKQILSQKEYNEQDMIEAGWWQECVQILSWALQLTKEISPVNFAETTLADALPLSKPNKKFISNASLLESNTIFEMYFTYNCIFHYLQEKEHLLLDADVILERFRTFKWLVGEDKDWK